MFSNASLYDVRTACGEAVMRPTSLHRAQQEAVLIGVGFLLINSDVAYSLRPFRRFVGFELAGRNPSPPHS